jgi:hypothetical protein
MVDEASKLAARKGAHMEFLAAGTRAAGAFHCSSCAYGVTVHGILPSCPMCAGTTWDRATWRPFSRRADRLQ